jgi:uncharacterized protein YchJ
MLAQKRDVMFELENICPCGSGELFNDCCGKPMHFRDSEYTAI